MARRNRSRNGNHFMDELAFRTGKTWRDLCDLEQPRIGLNGFLIGCWGDAICAAVKSEKAGLADNFSDGPAGQVLEYLEAKGFQSFMPSAAQTEEAAHARGQRRHPQQSSITSNALQTTPPPQQSSIASNALQTTPPAVCICGNYANPKKGGLCNGCSKQLESHTDRLEVAYTSHASTSSSGPSMNRPRGQRKALLIGINYFGQRGELGGCINDVMNIHKLLIETYGWRSSDIRMLTDDGRTGGMPTYAAIEDGLRWLVLGVQRGDALFFHFSGHGAQQADPNGYEEDGCNETIVPVDFESAGMMTDDHIGDFLVKPLPEGVKLTAVMDCCHSGTGLDLPFTWTSAGWREEVNPYHSLGDVQMFSGCEDNDFSSDAADRYGAPGGAMTTAFCDVLRDQPDPSYPDLLDRLHEQLRRRGFGQRPQLSSSQPFPFDRQFGLTEACSNMNPKTGRTFRQKFPPQPRPVQGPLADMLGPLFMVAGAVIVGNLVGSLVGDAIGYLAAADERRDDDDMFDGHGQEGDWFQGLGSSLGF